MSLNKGSISGFYGNEIYYGLRRRRRDCQIVSASSGEKSVKLGDHLDGTVLSMFAGFRLCLSGVFRYVISRKTRHVGGLLNAWNE